MRMISRKVIPFDLLANDGEQQNILKSDWEQVKMIVIITMGQCCLMRYSEWNMAGIPCEGCPWTIRMSFSIDSHFIVNNVTYWYSSKIWWKTTKLSFTSNYFLRSQTFARADLALSNLITQLGSSDPSGSAQSIVAVGWTPVRSSTDLWTAVHNEWCVHSEVACAASRFHYTAATDNGSTDTVRMNRIVTQRPSARWRSCGPAPRALLEATQTNTCSRGFSRYVTLRVHLSYNGFILVWGEADAVVERLDGLAKGPKAAQIRIDKDPGDQLYWETETASAEARERTSGHVPVACSAGPPARDVTNRQQWTLQSTNDLN